MSSALTKMRDLFCDLETFCVVPIKDGSHRYAEQAEVMLWSYALEDDIVKVWDLVNGSVHWQDDLSGLWESAPSKSMPADLDAMLGDPEILVWFQNGGQFDFPVLKHAMPNAYARIGLSRMRDTMVQAFAHALPGSLDKLGEVLNIAQDKRKLGDGRRLVRLFCKPRPDGSRATKATHPNEWQRFIEYAGGDITTMREVRRLVPQWNYKGKQIDLWHLDLKINNRGFAVDLELAEAAVRAEAKVKTELAQQTRDVTDDTVQAATQRDQLLKYILEAHGVDLPNMRADTLERRMQDPDLPEPVRELIGIRLRASMNSVSKYKTLIRGTSRDGRLRGCTQFRGASRTGRWAHRLFQPGNLPRPDMSHAQIALAIEALKADGADLIFDNVMRAISNTIRGVIVAPPGRKLDVADLSNIEGRVAAWLAGEEWKLQAFRDFDHGIGHDLYVLAYAKSFGVDPAAVPKKGSERQIGKVEELMFQYGGGVGAWLTGAATYGIDLDKMTEQVWDTLPEWAKSEAQDFLDWLQRQAEEKFGRQFEQLNENDGSFGLAPSTYATEHALLTEKLEAAKLKVRQGLPEKTFVACDAIKRLWRRAHPQISSYWKQLEDTVKEAIATPGVTFPCRKVKIRRDGAWLRIGLPSGRALCYPNPKIEKDGSITYTGFNQYTRQWGRVSTYGGKLLENITQAVACDQLAEPMIAIEEAGYEIVLHVHDELVCEVPDEPQYNAEDLARRMCADLGWNAGLPLAAAGFDTYRYAKE